MFCGTNIAMMWSYFFIRVSQGQSSVTSLITMQQPVVPEPFMGKGVSERNSSSYGAIVMKAFEKLCCGMCGCYC